MPKLRPINFSKIKNGDIAEAGRVIKDILMLTPRGPKQNQRAHAFTKFDLHPGKEAILLTSAEYLQEPGKYSASVYGYRSVTVKAGWFGYTDEEFYWVAKTLGAKGTYLNSSDFAEILRTHFPDVYGRRGAKLTRGCRRLERRMAHSWQLAIDSGKLGDLAFTCTVTTPSVASDRRSGYYGLNTQANMKLSFAGRTRDEAQMMLSTIFGHAVEQVDVRWQAWQAAEPAVILSKNVEELQRLDDARKKALSQIAELQQYIQNMDTLEEAVQMYSMTICE